mgnify:CR=1 FL=1
MKLKYPPLPNYCEACGNNWPLSVAHRHERWWYKNRPELLTDISQVITLCTGNSYITRGMGGCHTWYDTNKEARERLFMKKRGNEHNT